MNEQRTSEAQRNPALIHEALLYRDNGHLGDVVSDFAAQAARAGEALLVVLPAASEDVVRSAVCDSGAELHFEGMSACGRNPTCLLDLFEDWIEDHDGPVRVIDEPVWPGRRSCAPVSPGPGYGCTCTARPECCRVYPAFAGVANSRD